MRSDEKKKWADTIAMSHFLAGIESRATESIADRCKAICAEEISRGLQNLSLQFGGGEIIFLPFPEGSEIVRVIRY